ncbi:MAG: SDR family NAD(P)-dependent oxidoreductase, partial [Actinomycetota bacterium]|nr:SDR family NAD(P)-dependent oxidoreductase [Actinomycetota bacterium]
MRPAQHDPQRPAPGRATVPTVPPGVLLVTGGSRGIGAATARAAAAAGSPVALTYRDDEAAAEAVVS